MQRCHWCGTDPLYVKYHDEEWGVPVYDDQKLFEFLTLESAQAGLSWITILKKREGYRKAFKNFDVQKVAKMTEQEAEALMNDPGIVRNRAKIKAAILNAQRFIQIQEDYGSFALFQWQFVDGQPIQTYIRSKKDYKTTTYESNWFSHELKKYGFQFVGSTVIYAHMQACGMVNDHLVDCFRHREVQKLGDLK
jgi:DNA-3-methyladenine glycosylase I